MGYVIEVHKKASKSHLIESRESREEYRNAPILEEGPQEEILGAVEYLNARKLCEAEDLQTTSSLSCIELV